MHAKLNEADIPALARELEVGEPTLRDIFEALARPDRDPREDLPKPIFKKGVLKLEDLQPGMELKGTVLNVVDFGAFVDIGLKDSGLVHISQLANRYIKSPHDVVSVGDVVTVWVMGVDQERKRVSLTMVKPGTERPRGGPKGAVAGGGGAPQASSVSARRPAARPARRVGRACPHRPWRASRPSAPRRRTPGVRAKAPRRAPSAPPVRVPRAPEHRADAREAADRRGPRPEHGGGPGRFERTQAPRPQPGRASRRPRRPHCPRTRCRGASRSAPSASSSSSGRPARRKANPSPSPSPNRPRQPPSLPPFRPSNRPPRTPPPKEPAGRTRTESNPKLTTEHAEGRVPRSLKRPVFRVLLAVTETTVLSLEPLVVTRLGMRRSFVSLEPCQVP